MPSRSLSAAALGSVLLLIAAALAADPAWAQTAAVGEGGRIAGRVLDAETGAPVEGVTVVLNHPPPAEGGEARQEVRTTGADGAFAFDGVPAGRYRVDYAKTGYRASTLVD